MAKKKNKNTNLLGKPLKILNIGLEKFSKELKEDKTPVTQLDWKPPAGGDRELAKLLSKLGI
mgnify:FL=1|jgi:hypothetical protein|tara:strand:+ start:475 stop:660 length:186 start_codon:yes stop_codon:yes gene_type:complete